MSLDNGVLNTISAKQKFNTKSSNESEVVGASDYLPKNIWIFSGQHVGHEVGAQRVIMGEKPISIVFTKSSDSVESKERVE